MIPQISFGGETFYDISGIVTPNRYIRPITDGFALHHTAVHTSADTEDTELQHIQGINQYHITKGYGGFGYNAIVFPSGRVYTVGICEGARAHVAGHNNHLAGFVLADDLTTNPVGLGLLLGGGRLLKALAVKYGSLSLKGHQEWVTDPPQATSCPGNRAMTVLGSFYTIARALIDAENKSKIKEALREAYNNADLETLAKQIAYITGGRICGG